MFIGHILQDFTDISGRSNGDRQAIVELSVVPVHLGKGECFFSNVLKRLALIKLVPAGDSADLTVTERGAKVLSKGRQVEVAD